MATGGYKSYTGIFEGGASAPPHTVVGGYTSLEAFWIGGASAPPVPPSMGGYRSFEALWIGGAAGFPGVPPTPPTQGGGGGTKLVNVHKRAKPPGRATQYGTVEHPADKRRREIIADDLEIVALLAMVLFDDYDI